MKNINKFLIINLALLIATNSVFAIEDTTKKSFFSFFKREKNEVKLEKTKKQKRTSVSEIELPVVTSMRKLSQNYLTLSIEDCVNYAIEHNPNLAVGLQHIKAAEAGIGQQKSSFAPRLTARVNYNHIDNNGTRVINSHTNSLGFNAGISQLIWDFGKTTARINMAKYDTQSAQYDYDYDILPVTHDIS